MEKIIDLINKKIKDSGATCIPTGRVNLDYVRNSEYKESAETKASDIFEYPLPKAEIIKIEQVDDSIPTIMRYFLDGSRKTYKIADLLVKGTYLPLVAGQVGVALVKRQDNNRIIPVREYCVIDKVIAFPDSVMEPADLGAISQFINERMKMRKPFSFVQYRVKEDKDPIDLGVAKIMSLMADKELFTIKELSGRSILDTYNLLIKDGPLCYKNLKARDIDVTQFGNVIGISKSFRPSFEVGSGRKRVNVGVLTSNLQFGQRTPVFKTFDEESGKYIGIWYLRIREKNRMANPLDGIVKIERFALNEEEEIGLDSERVNNLSALILKERNVTPYSRDDRWPNHLYPVYSAETFIKSSFESDMTFEAIF